MSDTLFGNLEKVPEDATEEERWRIIRRNVEKVLKRLDSCQRKAVDAIVKALEGKEQNDEKCNY